MLQIHLSRKASKFLKPIVQSTFEHDASALQWYAHFAQVGGHDCLVLMERQSRYAMVFCGYDIGNVVDFPNVIQDRLWREACVITQLEGTLPEEDLEYLTSIALDLSSSQYFQVGSDPSVMAHISQVIEHLRDLVEVHGYPIPDNGADAMSFGLRVNEQLRQSKGSKENFIPLNVYRDFWFGLLDVVKSGAGEQKKRVIYSEAKDGDNVIHVDFKKRSKDPS